MSTETQSWLPAGEFTFNFSCGIDLQAPRTSDGKIVVQLDSGMSKILDLLHLDEYRELMVISRLHLIGTTKSSALSIQPNRDVYAYIEEAKIKTELLVIESFESPQGSITFNITTHSTRYSGLSKVNISLPETVELLTNLLDSMSDFLAQEHL